MVRSHSSLVVVGLLSAFSLLSFDLYQPSIPFITQYFATSSGLSQLTLSLYLLLFGLTQIIWGPLVDHFGRHSLLHPSLLLAAIASIICAFAPNIYILLLGRALQGIALCCSNLIAVSTARDFEDSLERAKVLSYISMIISVSPIIAPVIGAIIFTYFGWQANFIVMTVIALFLIYQAKTGLIESPFWHKPNTSFKINEVINSYINILSYKEICYGSLIMMFSFTAVMITVVNSSYIIIEKLGYSPLQFGIIFAFNGLNIIVGNYLGIALRKFLTMSTTIYFGAFLILGGGLLMLLISIYQGFNLVALSFALIANLGISITSPATMALTLSDFKQNTGVVVAIINTIRLLGGALFAILIGYFLPMSLNALPLGLILISFANLYCVWQFNKLINV